ncbi:MAG: RNA polymerase sigma-70 factor [Chitinophagaceae bacterium]
MTGAVSIEPIYYALRMEVNENVLINRLKKREEAAFEEVFKANYKSLHAYAFTLLREETAAEEMVQNVFYKLWERTESLSIEGSLKAYLYRAVHNESLNYLKHLKVRSQHQLHIAHRMDQSTENASRKLQMKELEQKVQDALNDLPQQCRTIFQLSRFEELRYREIAERLNISIKTVENQMGKALKLLRLKLVDFLPFIFVLIQLNPNT